MHNNSRKENTNEHNQRMLSAYMHLYCSLTLKLSVLKAQYGDAYATEVRSGYNTDPLSCSDDDTDASGIKFLMPMHTMIGANNTIISTRWKAWTMFFYAKKKLNRAIKISLIKDLCNLNNKTIKYNTKVQYYQRLVVATNDDIDFSDLL